MIWIIRGLLRIFKNPASMRHLILCCLLILASPVWAQEASPTPDPSQTPAVETEAPKEHPAHDELRLLKQHMEDAMNARDIDSLLEGVGDDVVFSTMNGDVVRGKDGIKSYFEKMMNGPEARVKEVKTKFEVDELTILYTGAEDSEDVRFGVAYGHSDDEYVLADDTKIKVSPQWSATMVRDDQSWKIVNFHYSVNMFDNPVVSAAKNYLVYAAIGGLLVGILLGFFIGKSRS